MRFFFACVYNAMCDVCVCAECMNVFVLALLCDRVWLLARLWESSVLLSGLVEIIPALAAGVLKHIMLHVWVCVHVVPVSTVVKPSAVFSFCFYKTHTVNLPFRYLNNKTVLEGNFYFLQFPSKTTYVMTWYFELNASPACQNAHTANANML